MISVLIVDDQDIVREGIAALLELDERLKILPPLSSGSEALSFLSQSPVDVVLLDIRMPGLDGIEVLRLAKEKKIGSKILMLSTFYDGSAAKEVFTLGASGYLLKDSGKDQLSRAIITVYEGGFIMDEAVTQALKDEIAPAVSKQAPQTFAELLEPLTKREAIILAYLAQGLNNREIAAAVLLSEGTVKNYVSTIYAKMDVDSRTKAVVKANSLGLF